MQCMVSHARHAQPQSSNKFLNRRSITAHFSHTFSRTKKLAELQSFFRTGREQETKPNFFQKMENANANNFPELERDLQHLAVGESELADQAEDVVGDRDGAAVAADEEVDVRTDEEDIEEEAEFNGQIEDINGQIEDFRRREQELEKVLEDVLTDVTSPEVSDEDEKIVEPIRSWLHKP